MSEQAIETEEETPTGFVIHDETTDDPREDVEEVEASEVETEEVEPVDDAVEAAPTEDDEDEEVEIVLEGEDEPTSTPAPRGVRRLINRVSAAKAEASEAEKRAEAVEAENKMLRERLAQDIEDKEPSDEDFETDAEYRAALRDYLKREAAKTAAEETKRLIAETQQQNTQVQSSQTRQAELDEHYKRVAKTRIKNYDELEETAIEVMGQRYVEEIAAKCDKSEIVLAHLGTNRGKAEQFARTFDADPVKALLDIGALSEKLTPKRKHSRAADPAVTIDKGIASTGGPPGARFE